jgi:molecular chaperone DnaJ
MYGGSSGDLYVDINIKDHAQFDRDEDDLFHELFIPFTLATLGGNVNVPTLQGKVSLKIPSGTQSNKTFRIKDKGMPNLRSRGKVGDLYVKISILVPTKLTKEQRSKLAEFAKLCGEKNTEADEGFMDKMKKIL